MRVGGDQDERGGGSVALVTDGATLISAPGRGARGAGLEVYRKTSGSVTTTSRGTVQSLLIVAIHGVRPPGELGPASP